MVGKELGLGHDPSRHAPYLKSWIKVLKDNPNEIFKAVKDAEDIKQWVLHPEMREALHARFKEVKDMEKENISDNKQKPNEKVFLNFSYEERHQAKQLGAKWDKAKKSMVCLFQ